MNGQPLQPQGRARKQATWIILAAIALNLLGIGIWIVPAIQAERSTGQRFRRLQAEYEAELVPDPVDLCRAAHDWTLARRQLFWRDKTADYDAYLAWLRGFDEENQLLTAVRATIYYHGGHEYSDARRAEAEKTADRITQWREEAEHSPERP